MKSWAFNCIDSSLASVSLNQAQGRGMRTRCSWSPPSQLRTLKEGVSWRDIVWMGQSPKYFCKWSQAVWSGHGTTISTGSLAPCPGPALLSVGGCCGLAGLCPVCGWEVPQRSAKQTSKPSLTLSSFCIQWREINLFRHLDFMFWMPGWDKSCSSLAIQG